MIRLLPLLLLTLLALPAFAAPVRLFCDSPATIFHISTQGEWAQLYLAHPMGIDKTTMATSTPIVGLGDLQKQAAVLKKLGDSQIVRWPLASCSMSDQNILYCTNGEKTAINGVQVHPILLRSSTEHLVLPTGEYDVFNVAFVFIVDGDPTVTGQIFTLSSNYLFERDCDRPSPFSQKSGAPENLFLPF